MKLSIVQHTEHEPAGLVEEFARQAGVPFETIPLFRTVELPPVASTHLLFLGGPMSVNQEALYPYLVQEKALIRSWIAQGRPVLGICLGAQLIAGACGGDVTPCQTEIGWRPVEMVENAPFPGFPPSFNAFQFHGETFSIPHGATLVCRGEDVVNQALAAGSALGVQFHLEATEQMIRDWISDLPAVQQSPILQESKRHLAGSYPLCRKLCSAFFDAPAYNFSWIQQ